MKVFFFLFLLVPLIELYVLIEVGSVIGALPTILLTITTALVGASLMRSQGLMTMQKAQLALASGEPPQQAMIEGVMIFIGGLFLLIPGFVTDAIGLLFLIPPVRHRLVKGFLENRQVTGRYYYRQNQNIYEGDWTDKTAEKPGSKHLSHTHIIEGEVVDDSTTKK